jgi:hypothetical protein
MEYSVICLPEEKPQCLPLRRPRLTFGETIIASIMKTAKTAIDIAVY